MNWSFTTSFSMSVQDMPANRQWSVRATKQVDGKTKPCTVTLTLYRDGTVVGQFIGSEGRVYNDQAGTIDITITLEEGVAVCDGVLEVD